MHLTNEEHTHCGFLFIFYKYLEKFFGRQKRRKKHFVTSKVSAGSRLLFVLQIQKQPKAKLLSAA